MSYDNLLGHLRPKNIYAGPLDPAFLYADKIYRGSRILNGLKCFKGLALSEAKRNRLVETSKCPTGQKDDDLIKSALWGARSKDLQRVHKHNRAHEEATGETFSPKFVELPEISRQKTPLGQVGCKTVIEYREWAEEYRVRTEAEATTGNAPPEQTERISTMLSTRGARKISESCEYMAMKKGGYKTFITGTFSADTRYRIYQGEDLKMNCSNVGPVQGLCGPMPFKEAETTIQKEVSRTMDGMQKLYARGFISNGERVETHWTGVVQQKWSALTGGLLLSVNRQVADGDYTPIRYTKSGAIKPKKRSMFEPAGSVIKTERIYNAGPCSVMKRTQKNIAYCWAVEIPKNKQGGDNPHVHLLMNWRVSYDDFQPWKDRIEKIWGNGYFHLEKIRDSNCAGSYMAKAAGYLSKAQGADDQGTVTGNRYGISSEARAPAWVKVSEGQLHIMGQLIADIYDHLTVTHGPKYRTRKKLNDELAKTPKDDKAKRVEIGKKLQEVREEIKAIPVRCNKYQVILKGKAAAARFFSWAKTPDVSAGVDWLPEKPKGECWREGESFGPKQSQYFRAVRRKFQKIKQRRHALTNEICGFLVDQVNDFKDSALSAWGEYEAIA